MTLSDDARLTRRQKLFYGAGDFGFSLTDTTVSVLFAIFLIDVVGLAPGLAALAVFLGRSWDYINDPLMGYLSDRTRSRWGRRRPYLLFGFIPFGIAFALLWWRPPIFVPWGLALYYALAYVFYDGALTAVSMPYYALTPELTPDYDERTALTSYRMAFSILGGLIAFTIPLQVIGTMRPENAGRVWAVAVAFGAAASLPLLLTFFSARERPEYASAPQSSLRESLDAARHNRPFLFAAGIFLFTWTAIEFVQGMLLFFLKYRMNLEAQSDLVAAAVFVTALVVLPAWEWASRKLDKRKAYIAGMGFLAAVLLVLITAGPSWGLGVVLALAALAGVGVSAAHVLTWAMIPDAVEWDQLTTGQRHEGMFYSLVTLLRKVATSITVPLALLALGWSGYVANAPVQTPAAVTAIRLLMGPVPGLFLLGGIAFAAAYPLGREAHADLRARLAAKAALDAGSTEP